MKTITVNVTQNDIDMGEECECQKCPIALAMFRIKCIRFKEIGYATIGLWTNHSNSYSKIERIEVPEIANNFMRQFDGRHGISHRELIKPFKFKVEVPNECIFPKAK